MSSILAVVFDVGRVLVQWDMRHLFEKLIEDAMKLHIEDRLVTGELIYDEVTAKKVRVTA